MSNQWLSPRSEVDDEGSAPSLTTVVLGGAAIVVGALFLVGVVVPAVFSLLSLVVPVVMVVIGARLVSKGDQASALARLGGWAAIVLGSIWFLDAINILNIARLVFIGLLIAGGVYVGRRLFARRA